MSTLNRVVGFLLIVLPGWGCSGDSPGLTEPTATPSPWPLRTPVGVMWGSGASGAMVEDTIPLVAYYRDSVDNPIGWPLPRARWSSSNPGILQVLADSIAVALDTGAVVLTAITDRVAADTVDVAFTVIPRWHGRLVWIRNLVELGTFAIATREYPGHEIRQLPPLGHPRGSYGNPFLSSDGSRLAVQAERDGGFSPGPSTVVIVDMISGVQEMPL